MRIVRAEVAAVAADFPRPLHFARRPMTTNTAVVVHLEEAGGAIGFGYAPTFGFGTEALRRFIADDFAPRIVQSELNDTQQAIVTMNHAASIAGRLAGSARQAIGVLETALLDIESKMAGVPLHRHWGQPRDSVRAYASGGWRYLSIAELRRFARDRVAEGFDAVKIQVGLSPAEDAARLAAVREVVGQDVAVMVDANERIPIEAATEWTTALAPFSPEWLEEPLPAADHEALVALRRTSSIPVAAGEGETELSELRDLLSLGAVDVIQPDVYRIGFHAAREVRDQASARNAVTAPHMAHELSVHLLSGVRAGGWLEYFDWFEDWWEDPLVPASGRLAPRAVAGHGLRLRSGWLETHLIRSTSVERQAGC